MFGPIKDLKKYAAKLNALVESAKRWWDFFAKKKSNRQVVNRAAQLVPAFFGNMRINFGGFTAFVA